jgi:2-methylisocitrate lyase-like PEP mutase family enzyme
MLRRSAIQDVVADAMTVEAVPRVARVVKVPVTADLEAGYSNTPREIAEFARATIATGVVGLNFEDITGDDEASFVPLNLQVEKIAALREAANSAGVPLVINARTDIYLVPIGPEETQFERTVERLRAYRKAGADCVFAPGIRDAETIGKLVKAVTPAEYLLQPGGATLRELRDGARASAGPAAPFALTTASRCATRLAGPHAALERTTSPERNQLC